MSEMDKLFRDNTNSNHTVSYVIGALLVAIVLFALAFYFFYSYFILLRPASTPPKEEKAFSLSDLGGVQHNSKTETISNLQNLYLLFSASPANSTVVPTLYMQAIDKADFFKVNKNTGSSIYNADLQDKTLIALEVNQSQLEQGKTVNQVARIIMDENFLDDFSVLDARVLNVNLEKFRYISKLALSPDKKYILISATDEQVEHKRAYFNAWSIYLINIKDASVTKLFNGVAPEWVSDSSFVFISENGLYIFNIKSKIGRLTIRDTTKTVTDELVYNKNSRILAWSNHRDAKIYLFKVKDTKIGIFNLVDIIKKQAISLAFNRNGGLLSFIEFDGKSAREIKNARLRLYDLNKRNFVPHRQEDDVLENDIYIIKMRSVGLIRYK